MREKLNNIINDTEIYLKTLKRFQNSNLYVDQKVESEIPLKKEEKVPEKPVTKSEIVPEGKTIKVAVTVEDLFGNVTVKKEEWEFAETLDELNNMICECQKCQLGATRTRFVFGVGNPKADIVLIGEAPGADEDLRGEPFVGRAGQLLNKILEATGFIREEVFICNILKCRPPGNRNPQPDETEKCRPYLEKQLSLLNPKLILLLGRVAAESLLKTKEPLNKLRGKIHNYKGYKVMVTFHPAALLRNPNWKRPTWDDMKQFKTLYESMKNNN